MSNNPKRVCIVVLNWNHWQYTADCIRSLQRLDYPNYNIVVVDNCSTDDSVARLRQMFPGLDILENGRNLGFAGGCNVGITHCCRQSTDYIWLLNNDTRVASDSLTRQVAAAEASQTPCLVGSRILDLGSDDSLQTLGGAHMNRWTAKVHDRHQCGDPLDYILGASLLVQRAAVDSIGLLDDWYFFYWEDADYSRRALRTGCQLLVVEDSRVYHARSGSSRDGDASNFRSEIADFHLMRGAVRFLRTYEGLKWPLPLAALFIKCCLFSLLRGRGPKLRRISAIVSGLLSGWRDQRILHKSTALEWKASDRA